MWPKSRLSALLGLDYPILSAPMANVSTPALAAAVSNAGGLGALACGRLTIGEFEKAVADMRRLSNRSLNVNFFAHLPPVPDATRERRMRELLDPYYDELGRTQVEILTAAPPFDSTMLEAVLRAGPTVVSFHFGLPDALSVAALKNSGIRVLSSATTVAEAKILEQAGADAIIAQGFEAGGHRGTFGQSLDGGGVGTLALVPQIVDAVSVPVIAAGGIADGRGIAAALALGASGVQIGTAFIPTPESGAHPIYKATVMATKGDQTRITSAFSGRPARLIANRYINEMAKFERGLPDFPLPLALTQPLAAAAISRASTDFAMMFAGQGAALARGLPAGALVERLVEETEAIVGRSATRRHGPGKVARAPKRRTPRTGKVRKRLAPRRSH